MKEYWREYKEWCESFLPKRVRKYLWNRNFEKFILIFLIIGIVYVIGLFLWKEEIVQLLR